MDVTPLRRSRRLAELATTKQEEEAACKDTSTIHPKKLPMKVQSSKKVNARNTSKKVNTHTPKKAQASKKNIDDVDDLAENLQNFCINGHNDESDISEEESVSSPDEDEGSIYEEETEDEESVDDDTKEPAKKKDHTPRKSVPDEQQHQEEVANDTSYSFSFGSFEKSFEKVDLKTDRRKADEAATSAKRDEEEKRRAAAEEAAAEIERKLREAEIEAEKKREEEESMRKKIEEDALLADKVLADHDDGKGSFYNVLEISKHASQDFITKAYKHQSLKIHPDKNKAPNAEEAFKTMKAVYDVLSCPRQRVIHDREIEAREASAEFQRQRENQRLRAKVVREKQRREWEVEAAMNAKDYEVKVAEKQAAEQVRAALKAKKAAEKQAAEQVKAALRAKRAAEKQASEEVKSALKAKKIAEKQASDEVKAALKAQKAAEKVAAKKSVESKTEGRSKSAPRPRRTATAWEEYAPGTSQYNTILPGAYVRAYAHAWNGGLAITRYYSRGNIKSFNVQSGHYIVKLDASVHSDGKHTILAVDPTDIFQIIQVKTRSRGVRHLPWPYMAQQFNNDLPTDKKVWVTSYDEDSSTYEVVWTSSDGFTHTSNIGHYDFIIPNGTVVRLEDISGNKYTWMNGKYGQIIRLRKEEDQYGNDRSRYLVQLSSSQTIYVNMDSVRL